MLQFKTMGKEYVTKKIQGKGERKLRPCLGAGCTKEFMTTPETRICNKCKRTRESSMSDETFQIYFDSNKI